MMHDATQALKDIRKAMEDDIDEREGRRLISRAADSLKKHVKWLETAVQERLDFDVYES
jgi:hypothetical protein